jgi:hypothetical protein
MKDSILLLATKVPPAMMAQKTRYEGIPMLSRRNFDGVRFVQNAGLVLAAVAFEYKMRGPPSAGGIESEQRDQRPTVLVPFLPVTKILGKWGNFRLETAAEARCTRMILNWLVPAGKKSWEEISEMYPPAETAATTYILGLFQGPDPNTKLIVLNPNR